MATSVASHDDMPVLAIIDGFVLDCLLSDNHTFESEVTEFPVESGSTVSDNIRPKPLTIAIEAIVSDTPLTFAGNFRPAGSVPSLDAYAKFLGIRRDRRLVSITTSLDTYSNMAMESLTVPRASGRGDEFRFNASFKQVQTVENKRTTRVAIPAAQTPSADNFTVVNQKGTGYRFVDFVNFTWYDPSISFWRKDVQLETRPGFPNLNKWQLFKAKPTNLTKQEWLAGSDNDTSLRAVEIKKQGGAALPVMQNKTFRTVRMLSPEFYVIVGIKEQF